MKISFYQQNISETERQHTEKNGAVHDTKGNGAVSAPASAGAVYAQDKRSWSDTGKSEKGKSLIEIQREAADADISVQQDYMTLMSHTMSEEDYAKLQEEGFDFRDMEPEEAVTIVDRIKAELARAGKDIKGYTDDLDMETLAAALGSQVLANAVADSFSAADIPMTGENLEAVAKAWDMASQLEPVDEGSGRYMVDNGLEPEIWNMYLAQNSGASAAGGNMPQFYAEDVKGYYTRSAGAEQSEELAEQIDRVIGQSGREVNGETRQNAAWLLENGLPLTAENLDRLERLQEVELPVTAEAFAQAAANTIADGKDPIYADLGDRGGNLYERAAALADYYQSAEAWDALAGDVTARRQLEEIRLRMTAEVNVKLLKSGFSIDTAPMEELVEALKQAERELAEQYFPQDGQAVEKYRSYNEVGRITAELPALPVQVVGTLANAQSTETLEEFHREGKALQESYEKARDSYETLMTSPRADMGDSIRKAFANVDDILKDLGIEPTEETRRAARILGYNRMDMTQENLAGVMEADRQVRSVIEKMTPAAVLKMIRDGINPLEKSFGELEEYFGQLPDEYRREAESYSRFLYGLEQNREITDAERESYIGIYRLMRQIDKSDGAVVGALVNTQAQLHFSNLLSAVRSGRVRSVDVKVADELGTVSELIYKGKTISEQIGRAFTETVNRVLTQVSYSEEAEASYRQEELEQLREAGLDADSQCTAMLQRGQMSPAAGNMMAAQALLHGRSDLFARAGRAEGVRKDRGTAEAAEKRANGDAAKSDAAREEAAPGSRIWEDLDDSETFVREYDDLTADALHAVEEASFTEADTSLDVREMQLLHKQLTVMGVLSKQREYFIPMYVGETLTRVHLTLEQGGSRRGTVSVGVQISESQRLEAEFGFDNGVLNGIITASAQSEVMELQDLADIFKEETEGAWTVGRVSVVGPGSAETADTENAESPVVDSAQLYRVAKVFLQAVQKRGI